MKLTTATATHEGSITGLESNDFSVAVNGKMFRTLIDGLYTNKIAAVVRELWANALDSHIAAGIPSVPFDCHLPSALDPSFRVRDYGVSLSHDDVMHLYTTLFDSTKDDTTDYTGALGLGSKSPFSYTDTFTVIARLDGRKRTYLAIVDEDDVPKITMVSDEEAAQGDDATGLEVILPVKADDFATFGTEAKRQAVGFDPVPNVDGVEIEVTQPVFVGGEGRYAIFRTSQLPGNGYGTIGVRQGCVIYPVGSNFYDIVSPIDDMLQGGYTAVIDVPIGSVGIVASREGLSMDEPTVAFLTSEAEEIQTIMQADLDSVLDGCKNKLEAQKRWFLGEDDDDNLSALNNVFLNAPTWEGKALDHYVRLDQGGSGWDVPEVRHGNKRATMELKHVHIANVPKVTFVTVYPAKNVVRSGARYRDFVGEQTSWPYKREVYQLKNPSRKLLAGLVRRLGLDRDQIVNIASIPDPGPAPAKARQKGNLPGVFEVAGSYTREPIAREDGLPTDYVWTMVDRCNDSESRGAWWRRDRLTDSLGIDGIPFLIFNPSAVDKLTPDPKKELDARRVAYITRNRDAMVRRATKRGLHLELAHLRIPGLSAPALTAYETAAHEKDTEIASVEVLGEARTLVEAGLVVYKERYPLLFNSRDADAIADYIAMCDAATAEDSEETS